MASAPTVRRVPLVLVLPVIVVPVLLVIAVLVPVLAASVVPGLLSATVADAPAARVRWRRSIRMN